MVVRGNNPKNYLGLLKILLKLKRDRDCPGRIIKRTYILRIKENQQKGLRKRGRRVKKLPGAECWRGIGRRLFQSGPS